MSAAENEKNEKNTRMLTGITWGEAPEETRQQALQMRAQGATVRSIAEATGISEPTLYYQLRRAEQSPDQRPPEPQLLPVPMPQPGFVEVGAVRLRDTVHDEVSLIELPEGKRGLVIAEETYRWLEELCIAQADDDSDLLTPEELVEELVLKAVWRQIHGQSEELPFYDEYKKWMALGRGQLYTRGKSS